MAELIKGKVKWYSDKSSYGFITGIDNLDYYFHKDDLKNFELEPLDEVEFRPVKTKRDWRAKNIKLINKAEKNSNLLKCSSCHSEITPKLVTEEIYPTRFKSIKKINKSFICPNCENHLGVYETENIYHSILSNLVISIICVSILTALIVLNYN